MIANQNLRAEVPQAAELVKRDRKASLAQLNQIFAQGIVPSPALDGRYRGALLTTSVNPFLDAVTRTLFGRWLPWKGKTFNAAAQIEPKRVKLTYLRESPVDLTSRVAAFIRSDGIDVPRAQVAAGKHEIQIEVVDTEGRQATQQLTLEVGR